MRLSKDTLTTVMGGLLAAGTAAQPVIAATQGSFNQGDWIKLVLAIFFAVQGWATNKA